MYTNHTFHLPFREMTITPLDFVANPVLSSFEEAIPFSDEACSSMVVRNTWLKDLFRVVASVKSGCSTLLWYTQLVDKVRSGYDSGRVSSEKLAR